MESSLSHMDTIPVIDARFLFDYSHDQHASAKESLRLALSNAGFLILRHSDLTVSMKCELIKSYRNFFSQPNEVKEQSKMSGTESNRGWGHSGAEQVCSSLNPDYKEFFDCGIELPEKHDLSNLQYYAPNIWPALPSFKANVLSYFNTSSKVAYTLLVHIAECLGYPSDYFVSSFTTPMSLLRGNYYPPRPATATEKDYGIAPHTDYGCLTLVVSDGVPGLEVQTKSGEWMAVNATERGDLIINFGDMLEIWSAGKIKATMHRVVGTTQERISSALFFNPNYDTNIAPKDAPPVVAGEYLTKRYNETYLHISKK